MALGKALEKALELRGMKAVELSTLTGVDAATISATIHRDSTRSVYATKFADALHISLPHFLNGEVVLLVKDETSTKAAIIAALDGLAEAQLGAVMGYIDRLKEPETAQTKEYLAGLVKRAKSLGGGDGRNIDHTPNDLKSRNKIRQNKF